MIFNKECKNHEKNKACIQSISKGDNSRQTGTFAYTLHSSDGYLSMYQVSFNSLLYFQRYAPDKLFIAKIKKGSNSVNTGDYVMVLAFCNSLQGPLLVYQVSFIYLQYFLRYAPYKHTITKIGKGNNSVITCDRVTVLALCTSSDGCLSMYQVSFNSLLPPSNLQKLPTVLFINV